MTVGIWWKPLDPMPSGYQPIRLDRFELRTFADEREFVRFMYCFNYQIESVELQR